MESCFGPPRALAIRLPDQAERGSKLVSAASSSVAQVDSKRRSSARDLNHRRWRRRFPPRGSPSGAGGLVSDRDRHLRGCTRTSEGAPRTRWRKDFLDCGRCHVSVGRSGRGHLARSGRISLPDRPDRARTLPRSRLAGATARGFAHPCHVWTRRAAKVQRTSHGPVLSGISQSRVRFALSFRGDHSRTSSNPIWNDPGLLVQPIQAHLIRSNRARE